MRRRRCRASRTPPRTETSRRRSRSTPASSPAASRRPPRQPWGPWDAPERGGPPRPPAARQTRASSRARLLSSRKDAAPRITVCAKRTSGRGLGEPGGSPSNYGSLGLVERRVDLRDLLCLDLFVGRILLAEVRRAAEVEPEVGEARAV